MPQANLNGLSPAQVQVASFLATGISISKAAELSNVGRTTIYAWLKTIPQFAQLIQSVTLDCCRQIKDKLHDFSMEALDTLGAIMRDEHSPYSVRLRAALAILNRPTFPDKGWALPYPVETPSEQRQQEMANQMEADYRESLLQYKLAKAAVQAEMENRSRQAESDSQPQDQPQSKPVSQEKNGTVRNTSEQKTSIFARLIPRSAPCPCGSGQKYKRCCGHNAPPVLSTAAAG